MSTTQQHLDPPVSVSLDHVRGKADARLTLVEYGDFQCPACIGAYGEVHRLEREFGDDLRVVFRHFPLTEMHPVGFDAARASEAAAAQGRFWEMHDRLFEARGRLDHPSLREYAAELELDVTRFDRELNKEGFRARVSGDREAGEHSGVTRTPAFFLHDVLYAGPYDTGSLATGLRAH